MLCSRSSRLVGALVFLVFSLVRSSGVNVWFCMLALGTRQTLQYMLRCGYSLCYYRVLLSLETSLTRVVVW